MLGDRLSFYLNKFSHLRTDRTGKWDASTCGQAPHKPFLLLSVLDMFARGRITANLIEINPDLGELFAGYWSGVMPPNRRGNLALPFFHLSSSGFWHLRAKPGQEDVLEKIRQVDTLSQLEKLILGAQLDEELFQLMQNAEARDALRTNLIKTYFSVEYQAALLSLGNMNLQAYIYSQHLIDRARQIVKEPEGPSAYQPVVRDQGFRHAVVQVYDHRCAFCGVRMMTSNGHTAVAAAHIIPWSVTHNDDLHNGMALCRLCHWAFDEGLLSVSAKYLMILSAELRISQNVPGHLLTLEHRPIIGPEEQALWPDQESLEWHRQNIFRRT